MAKREKAPPTSGSVRESLTFGMRTIGVRAHPGSPAWLRCVCTTHTPPSARRRTRARSCRSSDRQSRLKVGIKVSRRVIAASLRVSSKPNFYFTSNIIASLREQMVAAAPMIDQNIIRWISFVRSRQKL